MTQPIGSHFFASDVTGRVSSTTVITNKPPRLLEHPAEQKTTTDYVKNSEKGAELANQLFKSSAKSNEYSQTIYDQPSAKTSKAISTYTQFANLARREEVQNLIGVDIYA